MSTVSSSSTVWPVARAFGSQDAATATTVEEAEDMRADTLQRNRISSKELRDAMRAPFK